MKTIRFWLVIFAPAVSLWGTSYSSRVAPSEHGSRNIGLALRKPQATGHRGLVVPAAPKPAVKYSTRTAPMRAANPARGSSISPPANRGAGIQNPAAGGRAPVRPLGLARAGAPPLSRVRHRGSNPAIIAGTAELAKRNTGAINGAVVSRRP